MTTFREVLAQQLRAERAAAGLSLVDLADKSGVSRSALWRYEQGKRDIDTDQLSLVCAAFGLRMSEFIRRAEQRLGESNAMG